MYHTLQRRLDRLNKAMNRPLVVWTCTPGSPHVANVGNIFIDTDSPGDGRIRYHLCVITSTEGSYSLLTQTCRFGQMRDILDGMLLMLDLMPSQPPETV